MSVSEFRWDFPREVKCHPMHRCASIAPSLVRPRKKPCSFPPSEIVSVTIAAKRLSHQRHRTCMMRAPKIPFCPLRLPCELCALHGVWSACCACTRTETSCCFERVYFFAVFVISSTQSLRVVEGPTDRYDCDAQMRKSSAGALHLGAALRLFPLASSFAVLTRIFFALFTIFQRLKKRHVRLEFSFHFSNVGHLCVQSPTRSWQCHVGFLLFFVRTGTRKVEEETLAYSNAAPTKQLRQSIYLVTSAIPQRSVQLRLQGSSSLQLVYSTGAIANSTT